MCMDPSFALVNSPGPSHALFFQSVRYIAFFKREKKFSVYLFSSSSSPSLSSPVTPVFHRFVETHAFVKCDMLLKTPLCACCLLLCVFLCRFFFRVLVFQEKFPSVKTSRLQLFKTCQREREREMSEFDSGDRHQQQRRKKAPLHADSLIPGCRTKSHQSQREPCEAKTQACALDITLNMIEGFREMTWYRCADRLHHPLCSFQKTFDCLPEEFIGDVCAFKGEITLFSRFFYTQNLRCSNTDILADKNNW